MLPEEELLRQAAGQGVVAERMGLTPDWIISTTAFSVFQLPVRQHTLLHAAECGGIQPSLGPWQHAQVTAPSHWLSALHMHQVSTF